MRRRSVLAPLSLAALLAASPGCSSSPPPRSAGAMVAQLASADWQARQKAAEELGQGEGPPASAVPALYAALRKEQDARVQGALLVAFGASGAAEAKPLIDARIADPDADAQGHARRALKKWLVRNMLMTDDEELPPPPHRFYGQVQLPPGAPGSKPTPGLEGAPGKSTTDQR
jgi:hypothetical protein